MKSVPFAGHSARYSLYGFTLGVCFPLAWIFFRLALFHDARYPFLTEIIKDITRSNEHLILYLYMGIGPAIMLAIAGFVTGTYRDGLHERITELTMLRAEAAEQKDLHENRFKVLEHNIKHFHQISGKIQTSLNLEEILLLSAESLHDILGYERVNILMVQNGKHVRFVTAAGSDSFDITGITLPLDPSIGVIYKCISDKKTYLIDDISHYPVDYQIQEPHCHQAPLRSKSFILCPIIVKNEAIGAFGIDNKNSKRALNDSDMNTIMLFASQVASAITRINLLTSIDALTCEMENSFTFLLSNRHQYSRNVNDLREAIDSVADGSTSIASASEEVMSSVEKTSLAVNDISIVIEQVSRNLDHLAGIALHSASAMDQIKRTIDNVEQNTVLSRDISAQVKSRADEGIAVVTETINALAEIQSSVELSFTAIKHLVENSNRIETIIHSINNITKRTNLLALNAAIIASQAGEFGKSFGVVADEIRNLSFQTGHSTEEITAIIQDILSESLTAADNITTSKKLVQRGVELGHSAGETLKSILDGSARSLDMTQQIKQATHEQVAGIQIVAASMEEISSMTSRIFSSSTDQSKSTRSIVRSIVTIKDMAHEMVNSTSRQVEDVHQIRRSVESVSDMVREMFDNMEQRRNQSKEVIKELESMKNLTCQL